MVIKLVIRRTSHINVGSNLLFLHVISMMFNNSFVGMFEYIFEMLSDVSLSSGTQGMSARSFIRCTEFGTLKAFGSGMYSFNTFVNHLARF